jgi:hypothetical protein
VRHTFGTRLYGISKDIHLVQRAMNHTDINTTMRYVHTNREDIKAAMEQLDKPFMSMNERSAESHTLFSQEKQENIQKGNVIKMVPRKGLEPIREFPLVPENDD